MVNLPGIICGAAVDTGSDAGAVEGHKCPDIEIGLAIDVKHCVVNPTTNELFLFELGDVLRFDSFAVVAWLR